VSWNALVPRQAGGDLPPQLWCASRSAPIETASRPPLKPSRQARFAQLEVWTERIEHQWNRARFVELRTTDAFLYRASVVCAVARTIHRPRRRAYRANASPVRPRVGRVAGARTCPAPHDLGPVVE
jgi:hypothetical protein